MSKKFTENPSVSFVIRNWKDTATTFGIQAVDDRASMKKYIKYLLLNKNILLQPAINQPLKYISKLIVMFLSHMYICALYM